MVAPVQGYPEWKTVMLVMWFSHSITNFVIFSYTQYYNIDIGQLEVTKGYAN